MATKEDNAPDKPQITFDPDPRVVMAAERTLLAWIRTGLALMGFGFVVARFGLLLREIAIQQGTPPPQPTGVSQAIGILLALLGVIVNIVAARQYFTFVSRYNRGELARPAAPFSTAVMLAIALATLGGGLTLYLLWA